MDIQNNDLIKVFESFYRYKEKYGTIPLQTLKHSIHAGIAGLERGEKGNREIVKQSIADFELISNIIQEIYETEYTAQTNNVEKENNNVPQEIMSLDEVIKEYGMTTKIKDPQWRKKHPNFPCYQPTGTRGKVLVFRSKLEEYLQTKS